MSVAVDFVEDELGGLGPDEGTRIAVVLGDVAVDRGLEVDERDEVAAPQPASRERREEAFDGFSHEAEVGVKWNTQRGWRESQARTLGWLWTAEVCMTAGTSLPAGTAVSTALRKRMNS